MVSIVDLVRIAALFHELGGYNRNLVCRVIDDFLLNQGYVNSEREVVLEWIFDSRNRSSAINDLGSSIIWDANLVDELGATGLAACFRRALERGISFEVELEDIQAKGEYVFDELITQTAKSYASGRIMFINEYIKRFNLEMQAEA